MSCQDLPTAASDRLAGSDGRSLSNWQGAANEYCGELAGGTLTSFEVDLCNQNCHDRQLGEDGQDWAGGAVEGRQHRVWLHGGALE